GGVIMPRVLRNIQVREISTVDRGAGHGVKIMLMKRDDEQTDAEYLLAKADEDYARRIAKAKQAREETMPATQESNVQNGEVLWADYVNLIATRDKLSKSKAIDRALADGMGQTIFELAKQAKAYDVLKAEILATRTGDSGNATGRSGPLIDDGNRSVSPV